MISALVSFFGGTAFRIIWGELSSWWTKRQDHSQELDRMRLQAQLEADAHQRNMESIKLQAELGVKVIEAQSAASLAGIETAAWSELVGSTTRLTGITFIDIWNQSVRPMLATLAIIVVVSQIISNGFMMSDWDRELFGAILGIYVADRSLSKRGK